MSSPQERAQHARRRAQRERLLARRRRQARQGYRWSDWQLFSTWQARQAALSQFATTPKACSCWMCGNDRRQGLLTLQEKAWAQEAASARRWPNRWDEGSEKRSRATEGPDDTA